MLAEKIRDAFRAVKERNFIVPVDLMVAARLKGVWYQAMPMVYSEIRRVYWSALYNSIYGYLVQDLPLEQQKAGFEQAMNTAFDSAIAAGWQYGGEELPIDEDAQEWVEEKKRQELLYIAALWLFLQTLKQAGGYDAIYEALRRADGYADGLDLVYNGGRLRGSPRNAMLTFTGEDGKESCSDCRRLKNLRRPARWWLANDLIPPNRNFECKGYRCEHFLADDEGRRVTI